MAKITLLHTISSHLLDQIRCLASLDAPSIMTLDADNIREMRARYNETKKVGAPEGLSSIKIPKLKSNTWSEFKSTIIETLSRAMGRNRIPLSYIIRENIVGDFAGVYDSREDKLVSCLTFRGPAYKADNSDVFSILKQYTENTEGCSLIEAEERRHNGRGAWLSLLGHFEGETYKERVGQEANAMLRECVYHGPRKTLHLVITIHVIQKTHIKL